jgi:hypothetical protein
MFTYKRKFSLTVNATSLLTSLVNSRLYWFQAAVGIIWCATLLDDLHLSVETAQPGLHLQVEKPINGERIT